MKTINDKIKNEKMLETIFNNTHFLVAYMDEDFNFIWVNREYADKHNKDPEYFVGRNHFDLYPNGNESLFQNVMESGEPYFAYSKPLDHPVLGITYWDWAIQPIKNENNEIDSIILTLTDVTEYKRSEDEILKEQREFMDELAEKRVTQILSEKEEIKSESENMENELIELTEKIEELKKANKQLKKEIEKHKESEDDDFHFEAFDKQIKQLKMANENFNKIIGASNPKMEELYQQVKELKKARETTEDILSGRLSEINDLNERITELENEASIKEETISKRELEIEILNQKIIDLENKDSNSSKLIETKNLEIEEINKNIDILQSALDDLKEELSIKESDIKKLNHDILELKTIKEDSTEIISAEINEIQELTEKVEEQKQLINELGKRNKIITEELDNNVNDEELLLQLDELIKANEELEKFAKNAANELQEPLRAIRSFINVLAKRYRSKIDGDTDEFIDYALEAVERLNRKIIGLLEYSRIESSGKKFKLTETEQILDYALSHLNTSFENRPEITHENLPKVMADSGQILQLFNNLLDNAVKFKNPERNPQVHISAFLNEQNNEYVFTVEDNGIGIEEKDFDKIFDMFKKLNHEYEGIGIGLSIGKKIVDRHGGHIWVESEPEVGSTFFFTLPKP
ncbi:MAG: ATP-binding protein [Methanobacterium sp.]